MGESIHIIKKNAEALVITANDNGLDINADKPTYVVMSREQNAGRSYNIKIDYSSFERVEELKYMGTVLRNHNFIQEEIKRH